MGNMLYYIRKLYLVAGYKLIINFISMIIVSFIDGIGIYLLLPMLSIIGILKMDIHNMIPIPWLSKIMMSLSGVLNLPSVLAFYIFVVILQALLQRNQTILSMKIQQGFIRKLRWDTYRSLIEANWIFFVKKRRAEFSHILTTELARVGQGTNFVLQLAASVIFTFIQIGFAFLLSAKLTVLILICGLAIFVFMRKNVKRAKTLGDRSSELSQVYFNGITEHFNGIKDIKSNRLEKSHLDWFQSVCNQIQSNAVNFVKLNSKTQFFHKISAAVLVALFIFLSFEILGVSAEQLMLIIIIFSRLWPRFTSIQSSVEYIVSMFSAFQAVTNLQNQCKAARELTAQNYKFTESLIIEDGIRCNQVSFRYNEDEKVYALKDINLFIPARGMTAIVGKSGAGKSTLIDILMGLIQAEQGEILIDNDPLTSEMLFPLRSSISYVAQDPFLFHASIRENLMMVDPSASDEQLWEALAFSASDDFVRRLPQGIDTIIGDRGVRLSGGERQRIVLARAILRKPSILVLDEATSALDSENEKKIQEAIEHMKGKLTIIVIAHRLSTIRSADQVIVMEHGQVTQQGSYQKLSQESKGLFSKLLGYQAEVS
ncbi:ABC transporter ATP-binding protein [Paenibacillus hexagrammi]|uniref:ABC transporter ATP-binding protein/permease n=1 Tax=Paenibacillus hexagrammi TaxID=2908839 RepID=A0ABY3SKE4_9BACL|nr:ABC transporter ATP-binding protein [Paenibacillus sp. YPD9-1]UJF34308.1 ABC transporter ATP-binding protein/permease [Paenibacillus sp. YPD9-1]